MKKEVVAPSRRRTAFEKDLTKGSIIRNVLALSWPIIISQSLNMIGPTIDMIWVGKLGAAAIAGVGVAGMAVMLANAAMMGLNVGTRAMVARYIGAGDARGANHASRQTILVITGFAIVIVSIGIFFAEPILLLMGLEPDVVTEGAAYMRIMFVGGAAMSFRMLTEGIMQASGDVVTPMWISVLFRFVHVALCPFLVFGWWIFPYLGVSGAALSNVVSQMLGLLVGIWILFSGRTRLRLSLSNFRLDLGIVWRIVRVGIPSSIMAMQRGLGQLALMWLIAPFGTLAVAAHTLCMRIEMLLVMIGMGLGIAAGVLAGQNLGAQQPQRAERSGWLAAGAAEGIMIICSVAIVLYAESIVRIFTPELDVVELTSVFLRIAAVSYLMIGFVGTLMQCLLGAGDTVPPMLLELLTMWALLLPLAFFATRVTDFGVYGIRWAMVIYTFAGAAAYVIYFKMGRWKHRKV